MTVPKINGYGLTKFFYFGSCKSGILKSLSFSSAVTFIIEKSCWWLWPLWSMLKSVSEWFHWKTISNWCSFILVICNQIISRMVSANERPEYNTSIWNHAWTWCARWFNSRMYKRFKYRSYAMVAKIARNGCDRDRSRASMTSPMPKCPILKGENYVGYFGFGDVIDTRDLSLSQPFLAILATIA